VPLLVPYFGHSFHLIGSSSISGAWPFPAGELRDGSRLHDIHHHGMDVADNLLKRL